MIFSLFLSLELLSCAETFDCLLEFVQIRTADELLSVASHEILQSPVLTFKVL